MGITVTIGTYNGAARLPQTLEHLARQVTPPGLAWEVTVIDNASTDDTARVAARVWAEAGQPAPLRVLHEPQQGAAHARWHGLETARFPLVSFLDDDNWAPPDFLANVAAVMAEHPEAGACGGPATPVCEIALPAWFDAMGGQYACGAQGTGATGPQPHLWGAGLTVRRDAWQALRERGFRFTLDNRPQARHSGGDTELVWALRLRGWTLWFDPRLRIRHLVAAERPTEDYLRRLAYWRGYAVPVLAGYRALLPNGSPAHLLPADWRAAMALALRRWAGATRQHRLASSPTAKAQTLWQQQFSLGTMRSLWDSRKNYQTYFARIREAAWRTPRSTGPNKADAGTVLLVSRTALQTVGPGDGQRDYQIWHDLAQTGAEIVTLPFYDWHCAAQQQPRPRLTWGRRWQARLAARLPFIAPPVYPPRPFVPTAFYAEYERHLKILPRPLLAVLTDTRLGQAAELNQKHGVATIWCHHDLPLDK